MKWTQKYIEMGSGSKDYTVTRNQDNEFVKRYSLKAPIGRMANTKDMQSVFKMLISEDANYVNGINIPVDGGFTSW